MTDSAVIRMVVIWEEEVRELARAVHRFHRGKGTLEQKHQHAVDMATAALNLVNNADIIKPSTVIVMARKQDIRITPKRKKGGSHDR